MSIASGRGGDRGRGRGNTGVRSRGSTPTPSTVERIAQSASTPRGPSSQRGRRGASQRGGASARGAFNTRANTQRQSSNLNTSGSNPSISQTTTPPTMDDYKKRLDRIRAARPRQREQFISQGLMNPEGQMRLSDSVKLIGICTDMCPEFERVRRIVENDVKPPECTPETEHLSRSERIPDESRMVKAYARSAAGMEVELVSEMRSPITCLKTIDYLFDRLDHDEFDYLQNWIWDRTRAVRKDLRTQRIESKSDINILLTCLERTARFHLLSMHHMARSTKSDYTHQQDLEQLNQTMMSLRERYTDNRRASIPSENEAEFWAYRLILAPQYAAHQLEDELHRLPSHIRYNMRVQTAVEIFQLLKSVLITRSTSFVQCQANWKRLWELIKSPKVSYLMACAAEVSFNRVRHVVLDCLWRAFRVGNIKRLVVVEDWTTDKLKDVLGLDTDQEAVKLCEDFGFEFSLNSAGQTFLDITKKGYANQVLAKPTEDNPQTFSANLVESKRHDRALSAIIHGMSVQQAKDTGWLVDVEADLHLEGEMAEEHSLFVPETITHESSYLGQSSQPFGANTIPANTMEAKKPFNPFAKPFQPSPNITANPNPFLKAASKAQENQSTPESLTPSIQPGLFNASTNRIQFASENAASSPANATPVNAAASQMNPFLKGSSMPSATSIPQPNPFRRNATPSPRPESQATASKPAPIFTFPGLASEEKKPQPTASSVFPFSPAGLPAQASTTSEDTARQEAERERERQEAARKEQLEAEARRRVQEAQQARALKEAEERRKQAEAEAERRRQEQIQRDQERKAKEEQERKVREEQERLAQERRRQAQAEEVRIARARSIALSWESLTTDIVFHSEEGLLAQFIENTVLNMAQEVKQEEQKRKKEAELREQRRCLLARVVIAHWLGLIQKRKRTEQTRNRRKRIKEQRAQAAKVNEEVVGDKSVSFDTTVTKILPNGKSSISTNTPTVNTRRARRTQERRGPQPVQINGDLGTDSKPNSSTQTNGNSGVNSTHLNNTRAAKVGYSKTYHQSTAPIDRTETDWFKLRAMGIDPSKQRKRSFDSVSDAEEQPYIELKRTKLSPDPKDAAEIPPAPSTTAENQLARFRAIQQAFKKSEALPPGLAPNTTTFNQQGSTQSADHRSMSPIVNSSTAFHQPINGVKSINDASPNSWKSSQRVIEKARELVAGSSIMQLSPPNVQHDWGRSVPILGNAPQSSEASFGKSVSVSTTANSRPAYWGRASRFVPRHLYGKGPEAIKAYNDHYVKKSPSISMRAASTESPVQFSQRSIGHQREFPLGQSSQIANNRGIEIDGEESTHEDDESSGDEVVDRQPPDDLLVQQRYHNHQFAQMQNYENEDSDMTGTEEDSEPFITGEYTAAQYRTNNGYGVPVYSQNYLHAESEEVYEDYDEYSGEEDEEEEEEEEEEDDDSAHQQYASFGGQRFTHPGSQHSTKQSVAEQSFSQGGNTQDDAIELSD